ncbi:MAG: transcription antitermination factor NusB [Candidatus Dependentiae bacterium]|nr:transcription antitermination factor NusB [Candidatus Dependentiae bacterium]
MHNKNELEGRTTESNEVAEFDYNDLSRREVRSLIFHLLYAAEGFEYQDSLNALVDNFNRGFELNIPADGELVRIAQSVIDERDELDNKIKPLLHNWRFDRLGVITKLILRFAIWELDTTQTPSNVVINEAIELAKCFAEKDAYKFINGLLDEHVKKAKREL